MSKKCIDVSEFRGVINWTKVKSSGIDTVIIRVGGRYGISGKIYTDDKARTNLIEANKNKFNIGIYFFTQAVNEREAIEEANWTINFIKEYKNVINLPIYIDSEYLDGGRHNNIDRAQRTNVVKAFCEKIKEAGYMPGVYADISWLQNQLNMSELNYSVWVAQYYKECQYKGKYDIWQYSSTGSVPGIGGNVDMNIIYRDFSKKEKVYSDNIKVKAVDVIMGKYGNGEARKKALGSDYNDVQELVNELFGRMGLL